MACDPRDGTEVDVLGLVGHTRTRNEAVVGLNAVAAGEEVVVGLLVPRRELAEGLTRWYLVGLALRLEVKELL